jgi:hypothetical protein
VPVAVTLLPTGPDAGARVSRPDAPALTSVEDAVGRAAAPRGWVWVEWGETPVSFGGTANPVSVVGPNAAIPPTRSRPTTTTIAPNHDGRLRARRSPRPAKGTPEEDARLAGDCRGVVVREGPSGALWTEQGGIGP